jgi:ABC-type Co2+ transport system permease subunit
MTASEVSGYGLAALALTLGLLVTVGLLAPRSRLFGLSMSVIAIAEGILVWRYHDRFCGDVGDPCGSLDGWVAVGWWLSAALVVFVGVVATRDALRRHHAEQEEPHPRQRVDF